jgi:hypothetical protein
LCAISHFSTLPYRNFVTDLPFDRREIGKSQPG